MLAQRLNELFRRGRPDGRPWTNDAVAAELKEANPGLKVSGAYLSALRTGTRARPSPELLSALAAFFGVSPGYFFDDGRSEQILDQARELGVRRIALRAAGLPPESLDAVSRVLDEIRKLQGLPPVED